MRKAILAAIASATSLTIAACAGSDSDDSAADNNIRTIPVITLPFLKPGDYGNQFNTLKVECTDGGRYDLASPKEDSRVVDLNDPYRSGELEPNYLQLISVPDSETSVLQVAPSSGECTIEARQAPVGGLGEYTVTEQTVFAISVSRD